MQQKSIKNSERRVLALGDIAKELKIKKFVLRNWERELNLNTVSGSKKIYTEKEIDLFSQVKKLVYEEGLHLEQVRQELETKGLLNPARVTIVEAQDFSLQEENAEAPCLENIASTTQNHESLKELLGNLKQQLQQFQAALKA